MKAKLQGVVNESATYQQELGQITAELQRSKLELKEEKRRNEKLQLTLDIEKEANAQAQRIIEGIRNLDTSDVSDPERLGNSRRSVRVPMAKVLGACFLALSLCVRVCVCAGH